MRHLLWTVCIIGLAACSKKKDEAPASKPADKPAETKPGDPTAPTPTPPAPAPATPKRLYTLLSCEKLPKELKDKYFAGKELVDATNDANSGGCKVKDDPALSLEAACFAEGTPAGVYDSFVDRTKKVTDGKILTVGKVGVLWKVGNLNEPNPKVLVYDDNSECSITAVLDKKADGEAFAKDAVAAFPLK